MAGSLAPFQFLSRLVAAPETGGGPVLWSGFSPFAQREQDAFPHPPLSVGPIAGDRSLRNAAASAPNSRDRAPPTAGSARHHPDGGNPLFRRSSPRRRGAAARQDRAAPQPPPCPA